MKTGVKFEERIKYGEDLIFQCELFPYAKEIAYISDELYHYRLREGSISHSWSLNNVKDSWFAFSEKFNAMPDYQDKLLGERFRPIMRMWMSYSGYSGEEKADARKILREMQAFSKKNFNRVMKGNYPQRMKIICLLAQSKSAPVMWISYCGGKLRRILNNRKHRMFE